MEVFKVLLFSVKLSRYFFPLKGMNGILSTSGLRSINWADVYKSLRVAGFTLVSTFVVGAMGVAPQLDIATVLTNPKPAIAAIILAGLTAIFDLTRRWLTDYSTK
jgi:hypothetical protein